MVKKKSSRYYLIFFAIFLIVSSFLLFKIVRKGRAETSYFYPSACLGNWKNIRNAEGQPQLSTNSDFSDFNIVNSALYDGNDKQIFCSLFEGEIPEQISIKKAILRVVWSSDNIFFDNTANNLENNSPINNIINLDSDLPVDLESETEAISETVSEDNLILETENNSSNNNLSGGSFLEEVVSDQDSTESLELIYDPEINLSEAEKNVDEVSLTPTFLDVSSNNLLEDSNYQYIIRYSLDGSNWELAANIKNVNLDKEFFIPLNSVSDLSKVQISIESVNNDSLVYLDGMFLEVEYEKNNSIVSPDFENSDVVKIKSNENNALLVLSDIKNNTNSLWLYDKKNVLWEKIIDDFLVASDTSIFLDSNHIFWLSPDKQAVIGMDINSKNYFSGSLDYYNEKFSFDFGDFILAYDNGVLEKIYKTENIISYSDDNDLINQEVLQNFNHLSFPEDKDAVKYNLQEEVLNNDNISINNNFEEINIVNDLDVGSSIGILEEAEPSFGDNSN